MQAGPRVLVNALSLTHGGGRSYILNLLRELRRDPRGLAFTFWVADGQLDAAEASAPGLALRTIRLPSGPAALRLLARVLVEQVWLPIAARRHDVLFCVADMTPVVAATPTVVILRNLNIYDRRFYDNLRLRALYYLTRAGLRRVRRVLFPTRAAADLIRAVVPVPESAVAVVPYGISAEAFAGGEATRAERPFLLLPAAVERHKNVEVAIEGLAQLAAPLDLWVVGPTHTDPAYVDELRALAARVGVADRVRFTGPVPYATMLSYYRGASAFVFPSRIETFGHPVLEALLAGTPVVASDIPAFRELAGDAGRFFPPDDPGAFARAVAAVLAGPEATRARVAQGRARAAGFTWQRSVDRLCEILREEARR
jgi:glycosyltransferase involved in cell wall biosynthesis